MGPRKHVLDGGSRFPHRKRQFLEVIRPTEKHRESLLRCTQQKDHSVLNNGTTCDAAFRQNSLTTCFTRRQQWQICSAIKTNRYVDIATHSSDIKMLVCFFRQTKTYKSLFGIISLSAAVAQWVERWTCDQRVVGSNPTRDKPA